MQQPFDRHRKLRDRLSRRREHAPVLSQLSNQQLSGVTNLSLCYTYLFEPTSPAAKSPTSQGGNRDVATLSWSRARQEIVYGRKHSRACKAAAICELTVRTVQLRPIATEAAKRFRMCLPLCRTHCDVMLSSLAEIDRRKFSS